MLSNQSDLNDFLDSLDKLPLITPEKEAQLFAQKENPEKWEAARTELIESNIRLAISQAKRFRGKGVEFNDLIQVANAALVHAVDLFDPTLGYRLSTYATIWMRSRLSKEIGHNSTPIKIGAATAKLLSKFFQTSHTLYTQNKKEPTLEEVCEYAKLDPKKIGDAVRWLRSTTSIQQPSENNHQLEEIIKSEEDTIEESFEKDEQTQQLQKALKKLSQTERQILIMSWGLDQTQAPKSINGQIAEELNLPPSAVRRLKTRAENKLAHPAMYYILQYG